MHMGSASAPRLRRFERVWLSQVFLWAKGTYTHLAVHVVLYSVTSSVSSYLIAGLN